MGRLGTPSDVGNAVAMICSEEADWITGQLIDVDGGAALFATGIPRDSETEGGRSKVENRFCHGSDRSFAPIRDVFASLKGLGWRGSTTQGATC